MKGCPEPKKSEFLKELKRFLHDQIVKMRETLPAASLLETFDEQTKDEKIGKYSFVIFDKNKNSAWERKEWKPFRELVLPHK